MTLSDNLHSRLSLKYGIAEFLGNYSLVSLKREINPRNKWLCKSLTFGADPTDFIILT